MTDLQSALHFILRRVEEEATRAGMPLNEEEQRLLHDLPTEHVVPEISSDPALPSARIRDFAYERLCSIAKAAYEVDRSVDSDLAKNWELAANVAKLHHHPVAWLLDWAGVKYRKPWWDRLLLAAFALLLVIVGMIMTLTIANEPLSAPQWDLVVGICALSIAFLFIGTKRLERWQLRQNIQKLAGRTK